MLLIGAGPISNTEISSTLEQLPMKQHPLSATLEMLRLGIDDSTRTSPVFKKIIAAPKFYIQNHKALPSPEQANQSIIGPLPFSYITLGYHSQLVCDKTGTPFHDEPSTFVICCNEIDGEFRLVVLLAMTTNSFPILLGTMSAPVIKDAPYGELIFDIEPAEEDVMNLLDTAMATFVHFMALLSADNVYVSPPPTKFARKRELDRIKRNKRVENYHIHHLSIARKRSTSTPTDDPSRTVRGHWRRAHLRHYTKGIGNIKRSHTIAIAPMYVGSDNHLDKDYII